MIIPPTEYKKCSNKEWQQVEPSLVDATLCSFVQPSPPPATGSSESDLVIVKGKSCKDIHRPQVHIPSASPASSCPSSVSQRDLELLEQKFQASVTKSVQEALAAALPKLITLVAGAVQPAKKLSTPMQKDAAVRKKKKARRATSAESDGSSDEDSSAGEMTQEPSPNKRQLRRAYHRMRKRCQVAESKVGQVTKKKRKYAKLLKLRQKEAYEDLIMSSE
jgi:hypothetical protein